MIDRLKNTSIQDLAIANVLGYSKEEIEEMDLHQQRMEFQNLAFNMQQQKETISQEIANNLNRKYQEIVSILENEYDEDLSCDYQIDFDSFVIDNKYYNKFSY